MELQNDDVESDLGPKIDAADAASGSDLENSGVSAEWPDDRRGRVLRIAEAWGCSAAYVYQVEKRGCPLDSLGSANEWRVVHAKLGVGYRSRGLLKKQKGGEGEREKPKVRKSAEISSLEDSLREAVRMEEATGAVVKAYLADPDKAGQVLTAMNAFNKAQANRMEREKGVMDLLQAQKRLVPLDFAMDLMRKGWMPLLARLRSMGKRAGAKANPSDDVLAEAVITSEVEETIAEAERAYADLLETYA